MADDQMGASQLRQRYGKGGSAADGELSASQLRARYNIPSNSPGWASSGAGGKQDGGVPMVAVAGVAVAIILLLVWFASASA
mmetsp:Transcript_12541/g.43883  ORF Transcript_12541/g.43883 Transcript_12541/m.43883 type:complete len:82 (-) Transcript_12541:133-378(-)